MKKVIILKGLPASGKTQWAKEQINANPNVYKRVNKDDLRAMIDNGKWSADSEKLILKIRDSIINLAIEHGKHVIVDDTNLHPKHEERIRQIAKGKAEVIVKFFDVPLEDCIKRDSQRVNPVGRKTIQDMYDQFLKSKDKINVEWVDGAPFAIICDIDGTLAIHNGRSPYEWNRVIEDKPNRPVVKTLDNYKSKDENVIITLVSGRDEVCRKQTEQWLKGWGITYDELYMRPEGNTEKDSVIKERIYRQYIEGKYNVFFVLDDRDQTVRLWRELGLTCFQVADGNF